MFCVVILKSAFVLIFCVFGYCFSTLAVILVSDILKTKYFHIESSNGPMIISVVSSLKEDIEADTLRQPRVFHRPLTFVAVMRVVKHTPWDSPAERTLQS